MLGQVNMAGAFKGLTDAQWEKISKYIPQTSYKRGRPPPDARKIINTILYVLITGCRWCDVPIGKQWGKRSTAHQWLGLWRENGTTKKIQKALLSEAYVLGLIDWSHGSVDGSFAAGKGGGDGVNHGFKGKGVTLHALVEGNGMPIAVTITPANGSEREQVMPLLEEAQVRRLGGKRARNCPKILQADKGYDSKQLRKQIRNKGVKPIIPKRKMPNGKRPSGRKQPKLIDRWKVERAFAWAQRKFRRICIRWERQKKYWAGFVDLAVSFMWLGKVLP